MEYRTNTSPLLKESGGEKKPDQAVIQGMEVGKHKNLYLYC